MLTIPEVRLSASNAAVLSSSFALLPVGVRCEAKDAKFALKKVEEIISALREHSAGKEGQVEMVAFEEPISPRLSRVDIARKGKESSFGITVAVRARFPVGSDFWSRIAFVNDRYEWLATFALGYEDAKGVDIFLEEARLEQQKEEPERFRVYRK
jgi:hypothetical protein